MDDLKIYGNDTKEVAQWYKQPRCLIKLLECNLALASVRSLKLKQANWYSQTESPILNGNR